MEILATTKIEVEEIKRERLLKLLELRREAWENVADCQKIW